MTPAEALRLAIDAMEDGEGRASLAWTAIAAELRAQAGETYKAPPVVVAPARPPLRLPPLLPPRLEVERRLQVAEPGGRTVNVNSDGSETVTRYCTLCSGLLHRGVSEDRAWLHSATGLPECP